MLHGQWLLLCCEDKKNYTMLTQLLEVKCLDYENSKVWTLSPLTLSVQPMGGHDSSVDGAVVLQPKGQRLDSLSPDNRKTSQICLADLLLIIVLSILDVASENRKKFLIRV